MVIRNEKDIIKLIEEDPWMMEILRAAKSLKLPDWWICAGFVRSKIWDTLHGFSERTLIPDIDVIYFDKSNIDEDQEKKWEEILKNILPNVPWSVKNEGRMHMANNVPSYLSCIDAMSKFPETATALGIKIDKDDHLILAAPYGISDVIHLEVKPTPYFLKDHARAAIYAKRMAKKKWESTWNKIKVYRPSIKDLLASDKN